MSIGTHQSLHRGPADEGEDRGASRPHPAGTLRDPSRFARASHIAGDLLGALCLFGLLFAALFVGAML